jgi:hypothetical protein
VGSGVRVGVGGATRGNAGLKALGPCVASACATSGGVGRWGTWTPRAGWSVCCHVHGRVRRHAEVRAPERGLGNNRPVNAQLTVFFSKILTWATFSPNTKVVV